jgi:acyl-CoA thioesterase-1
MKTTIATSGRATYSLFLAVAGCALACTTGHGKLPGPTAGHGGADDGSAAAGGDSGAAGVGTGRAGAGGAGAGGEAVDSGPACVVTDPDKLPGRVQAPNPLISQDRPVVAGGPLAVENPEQLVDGLRSNGLSGVAFGVPTESEPAWVAIDLGEGPGRVLLIWRDPNGGPYTAINGGAPYDYHVDTSADSTDGEDGTWDTVTTVTSNPVHVREHAFDFSGQRWVKLVMTAAQPKPDTDGGTETAYPVKLDEISVFDLSETEDGHPSDSWLFMGDSITQGAFVAAYGVGTRFDELLHASQPDHYPAMVPAGITSELATDGVRHITEDDFLKRNPDMLHVAIGYGTNDSWGNKDPLSVKFEETMETLVEAVLAAGRVPILARIPYACEPEAGSGTAGGHLTIPEFNEIIDRLQAKYELPCGPDLYAWFRAHPEQLSDCVHPNPDGYREMNRLWAEAASVLYPSK